MKIKEIMSRNITSILPDASVKEVFLKMLEYNVPCLPVIDKGKNLLGFIFEEDLLSRIKLHKPFQSHEIPKVHFDTKDFIQEQKKLYGEKAIDIINKGVITTDENANIINAFDIMLNNKISYLPVMRKDKLVGFLTRQDILKAIYFLEESRKLEEAQPTDEEITYRVFSALKRNLGLSLSYIKVRTYNAEVHLHGAVASPDDYQAAEQIASSVPGVKRVTNLLLIEKILG